ncbi:MAG: DUF29 domain-containing protein [Acetobacteraceae bacterium]
MRDGLYERDALAWAEEQATLLRRLAAGERPDSAVDWPNVIGEVRDVGLSELRACQSLLQQAMVHLLKLHAWPTSAGATHWRDEAGVFLDDAERRFTSSMRQRISLHDLYVRALRRARAASDDAGTPRSLPEACPFTLDDLLAGDVAALVGSLNGPA